MLVLTRGDNQGIRIGGNVTVFVRQHGTQTKVVIDAPRDVKIARLELVEEQPEQGRSQDGARMDCEGHEAPFYSEKSILNSTSKREKCPAI